MGCENRVYFPVTPSDRVKSRRKATPLTILTMLRLLYVVFMLCALQCDAFVSDSEVCYDSLSKSLSNNYNAEILSNTLAPPGQSSPLAAHVTITFYPQQRSNITLRLVIDCNSTSGTVAQPVTVYPGLEECTSTPNCAWVDDTSVDVLERGGVRIGRSSVCDGNSSDVVVVWGWCEGDTSVQPNVVEAMLGARGIFAVDNNDERFLGLSGGLLHVNRKRVALNAFDVDPNCISEIVECGSQCSLLARTFLFLLNQLGETYSGGDHELRALHFWRRPGQQKKDSVVYSAPVRNRGVEETGPWLCRSSVSDVQSGFDGVIWSMTVFLMLVLLLITCCSEEDLFSARAWALAWARAHVWRAEEEDAVRPGRGPGRPADTLLSRVVSHIVVAEEKIEAAGRISSAVVDGCAILCAPTFTSLFWSLADIFSLWFWVCIVVCHVGILFFLVKCRFPSPRVVGGAYCLLVGCLLYWCIVVPQSLLGLWFSPFLAVGRLALVASTGVPFAALVKGLLASYDELVMLEMDRVRVAHGSWISSRPSRLGVRVVAATSVADRELSYISDPGFLELFDENITLAKRFQVLVNEDVELLQARVRFRVAQLVSGEVVDHGAGVAVGVGEAVGVDGLDDEFSKAYGLRGVAHAWVNDAVRSSNKIVSWPQSLMLDVWQKLRVDQTAESLAVMIDSDGGFTERIKQVLPSCIPSLYRHASLGSLGMDFETTSERHAHMHIDLVRDAVESFGDRLRDAIREWYSGVKEAVRGEVSDPLGIPFTAMRVFVVYLFSHLMYVFVLRSANLSDSEALPVALLVFGSVVGSAWLRNGHPLVTKLSDFERIEEQLLALEQILRTEHAQRRVEAEPSGQSRAETADQMRSNLERENAGIDPSARPGYDDSDSDRLRRRMTQMRMPQSMPSASLPQHDLGDEQRDERSDELEEESSPPVPSSTWSSTSTSPSDTSILSDIPTDMSTLSCSDQSYM